MPTINQDLLTPFEECAFSYYINFEDRKMVIWSFHTVTITCDLSMSKEFCQFFCRFGNFLMGIAFGDELLCLGLDFGEEVLSIAVKVIP